MSIKIRTILVGGFGNQLFQLAYTFSQAEISEVELIYGLGDCTLGPDGMPLINSFLNLETPIFFREVPPSSLGKLLLNLNLRLRSGRYGSKLLNPRSALIRPFNFPLRIFINSKISNRISFLNQPEVFLGYFQSDCLVQESVELIRRLVKEPEQSPWIRQMKERAREEAPLIVHIRLGDYFDEVRFGVPERSYFAAAIETAWKTGRYEKIWIFSNDSEKALDYLPAWCFESCEIVLQPSGDTLETFEVMRAGNGYVISNSTYGWWAARLSLNRDAQVFVPDPWFKDLGYLQGIYPETWRRIPSGL